MRSTGSTIKKQSPAHARLACLLGISLCLAAAANAAPLNILRFPFTNSPGSTTMLSDTSFGGVSATLPMFTSAGVAADYHGAVGSGVLGALIGSRAMVFTNNQGTTQPANATGGGTAANPGSYAVETSDAALGFGTVTNFVITMWINQLAKMPSGGGFVGPRLFILSSGAPTVDTGVANSIGVKFQQANQLFLQINTGNPTVGPALAADLPTNKWLFLAWVYDGTNAYQYNGSDTQSASLAGQASAPNQVVNLGSSPSLIIGNRGSDKRRSFNGWIEDFRIYTNVASAGNNAIFVENIRQQLAPLPAITGITPDGTRLMQGTNTFAFNASSPGGVNISNVSLVLNSVNVSAQLQFVTNGTAGTSTNLTVSYTHLPTNNPNNTAVITIADANGLGNSVSASFDTFTTNNFIIEAEEFDHDNGQFFDNPNYTDGNTPFETNSYFGLDSVEGVDSHKGAATGIGAGNYRYDDGLGHRPQTPIATGEAPWWKFDSFVDTNGTAIVGHMLNNWSSAEWQNYTKTFPAGQYNVYARASTASGGTITFDRVTSGQGTSSQTTTNLGSFTFSGSSLAAFQWVPLRDGFGQLAVLNLFGANTVRATTGGGANLDFFMLVPANVNLPVLSGVYPNGKVLFQSTNRLVFTVSSQVTSISTSNIHLTLNGSNVSSGLVFSGGPSTWNVNYPGLQVSQTYSAVISVTDDLGTTGGGSFTFDTWNPLFQVEAEDFDFDPNSSPVPSGNGLRFIDNAVPTAPGVPAVNSYEGQIGVQGIDESGITAGQSSANYRPNDQVATSRVTDATRQQFVSAGAFDYNVGFLGAGFWQNYTRTWPSGTYNVYARLASGANIGNLHASWSQVLLGAGTSTQLTKHLGSFTIPSTAGYSSYVYAPLIDRFGNYANLPLAGTNTYRITELTLDQSDAAAPGAFGLNANFYMLVAPRTDLPRVDNVYPDGAVLMQKTNTLTFTASSPTYGVRTTNIQVVLNGVNISSNLTFTGSSPSWDVSYSGLQSAKAYTAVITVTDNTNQVHTTTVTFDTFDPNAFAWEAEDWDFEPNVSPVPNGSGLRFIDNPALTSSPATNSYFAQEGDGGQISGAIDYSTVFGLTHPGTYTYRPFDFVSAEVTTDAPRQNYLNAQLANLDPGITDRDVNFWATNGWINYTRTFPAGNYYLYARLSAGNGAFNLQCAKVTSGAGTTTQTTSYVGTFTGSGTSFNTWQYVPLVNTNISSTVPVAVSLAGLTTLQLTGDFNEDVNFFTLVPIITPVQISASISGPNIVLSFPTQNGVTYSVYYKNDLSDPTWSFLTSVSGDGSVKSVNDPKNLAHRFYRLTLQ